MPFHSRSRLPDMFRLVSLSALLSADSYHQLVHATMHDTACLAFTAVIGRDETHCRSCELEHTSCKDRKIQSYTAPLC